MNQDSPPTLVWDAPTRIVHWAIVVLLALCWFTAQAGRLDLHRWAGYAAFALILFRIYWGLVGPATARFSQFVRGPRATAAYLRTLPRRTASQIVGHNPLGAWSVVAILATLAAEIGFGLFAVDVDGVESGPLSYLVDFDTGRRLAHLHAWTFNLLCGLAVAHIAAIVFYWLYKRENLVRPMLTGRRRFSAPPPHQRQPAFWRLVIGVALAGAIVWFVALGLRLPTLLHG